MTDLDLVHEKRLLETEVALLVDRLEQVKLYAEKLIRSSLASERMVGDDILQILGRW